MEPINHNLTQHRLSHWVIDQLQQSLGISRTMRLNLDSDNADFWRRSGDGIFVHTQGTHQKHAPIEVTFFWPENRASVWVDDMASLIRPERYHTFDRDDFPDVEFGAIERNVSLEDALERIEIWSSLPPKPRPGGSGGGTPPTVVGM